MKDRKQYPSRRAEALRAYRIRRRLDPSKLKCACTNTAVTFASGGDPVCARCRAIEERMYGHQFKAFFGQPLSEQAA